MPDSLPLSLADELAALPVQERAALERVWAFAAHAAPEPPFGPPPVDVLLARVRPSALPLADDHTPARRARLRTRTWARIGAVLGVVTLGGAAVTLLLDRAPSPDAPAPVVASTQAGQSKTLRLADGSTLALAGATRVETPDARTVRLDGEAYFDVAHDPARPFEVSSGDVTVTVLGTAFNVRAYAGRPVEVAVERGRVRVVRGADTLVLGAGQYVAARPGAALTADAPPHAVAAWRSGAFHADDAPLADIAVDVERRFGTRVVLAEGLEARRWTLALEHAASADDVLTALAGPMGLHVQPQDDGSVRLSD